MIQINEGNNYQDGRENKKNQKVQGGSEFYKEHQRQKAGEKFDQRVTPGNLWAAVAAFGAQNQKAYNRNIIVKANRMVAGRTLRRRLDNGFSRGNAENADIKKAADGGAENEGKNI